MVFSKLSSYLYDARVTVNCDHAPLYNFSSAYTLNSKVNSLGTEIASMSPVIFEHIEGTGNILVSYLNTYIHGAL